MIMPNFLGSDPRPTSNTWTLLTAVQPGAIAIVQLQGDVQQTLSALTGRSSWQDRELHLLTIPDIDEVIAVKINSKYAQVMPHGGMQVLRRLAGRFADLGIEQTDMPQFPEAADAIEEAMLRALSSAESPLAVHLLLQQPSRLRRAHQTQEDRTRSERLNHLITPPRVVLVGAPNTGKSTLMNALTKQSTSIVHPLPGATRDAVGARVNCADLVIDLYDLPGYRDANNTIERASIELATNIASTASLTILIADSQHDWISTTATNKILIGTKSDLAQRADAHLCVSAITGDGIHQLGVSIRDALVPPSDIQSDRPWFFYGYSPTAE